MEFHCIRECTNRKSAVWGLNVWALYLTIQLTLSKAVRNFCIWFVAAAILSGTSCTVLV
jgi:hypothetical protein